MNRLFTLFSLAVILPGCVSRYSQAASTVSSDDNASVDTSYLRQSEPVAEHHDVQPAQVNTQPDYFFAVALYNTVYYGNSLENLAKLRIESAQLDISPDGKSIAYSSYSHPGQRVIKIIDIDSQEKRVLDIPQRNVYMGSWNNNGKYIVLNSQETELSHWRPVLYDVEDGRVYDIDWLDAESDYYNPVFSPDGRKLVFHDVSRIYICDFFKGQASLSFVINTEDLCTVDNAGFSDYCKFQLSSDGNYLVFTVETDILEEDICPKITLCCYNIHSGRLRRITDGHCSVTDFALDSAGEIYYCTSDKENQIFEGYMTRVNGTESVKYATFKEQTYSIAVAK